VTLPECQTRVYRCGILLVAFAALATSGCLQIDTHIKLHEDGSATITERVQFSRRLLESQKSDDADRNVAVLLEKKTVLERMKHMGKGIHLVSHKVSDVAKGARECVSVFKIPNVADLKYVSPFFGHPRFGKDKVLLCRVNPLYSSSWTGTRAGYMEVAFTPPNQEYRLPEYKRPSPSEVQKYRDLGPVFADMLKGLRLRLVFECYAPVAVRRAAQRNARSRPKKAYLLDISGGDVGGSGAALFRNEEAMADLLQMHINGPHIRGRTGSTAFRFGGAGLNVMFRPSKHYFDKYFTGKTLNFGRHGKRKASFKHDGYHPEPTKNKDNRK